MSYVQCWAAFVVEYKDNVMRIIIIIHVNESGGKNNNNK